MDLASAHAVTVRGSGETTIVLAHGLGGSQVQWGPVADRLAEHARVVTFDLAGSGAADPSLFSPVRHASIVGFADDLSLMCAELGLRDVAYVGHSMSGMAGALAAAADPGLFARLVLLNASACYVDHPVPPAPEMLSAMDEGLARASLETGARVEVVDPHGQRWVVSIRRPGEAPMDSAAFVGVDLAVTMFQRLLRTVRRDRRWNVEKGALAEPAGGPTGQVVVATERDRSTATERAVAVAMELAAGGTRDRAR